jgi:cell fate (sporulation/competence/biofilm development) regulator YlbF (YheA/YmcA/DUF963 family)
MSTEKKVDRDASIQKLTAEYNTLKIELENAQKNQSNPDQIMYVQDLKREMHQTYKDLRWAYGMKAIEEEAKKKANPDE